jgi:predicted O-methyltransferase YrrM
MEAGRVGSGTIGEISRRASKSYFWSQILFQLVRHFKPVNCLELGTCLGISSAYQGAALNLNQRGQLITIEGSEALACIAKRELSTLGLDNVVVVAGKFQEELQPILERLGSVDYAFIDGHHDEDATLAYYRQVLPFLSLPALLVFDDINWSEGMKRAWKAILEDERVSMSVDLRQIGICLLDGTPNTKAKPIRIPLIGA